MSGHESSWTTRAASRAAHPAHRLEHPHRGRPSAELVVRKRVHLATKRREDEHGVQSLDVVGAEEVGRSIVGVCRLDGDEVADRREQERHRRATTIGPDADAEPIACEPSEHLGFIGALT